MVILSQLWNKLWHMHITALSGTCRWSENGLDAKPFLSDMFPQGACRKTESAGNGVLSSGEKNFSVHQTYMNFSRPRQRAPEAALYVLRGRSMVEMLGVLSIIGVLSVGAISGYQKAMFKYKLNKSLQQLTFLTNGLLQNEGLMREMSNLNTTRLAPYVAKFNLLPDGMSFTDNDVLLDALGNRCKPFTRSNHLVIDYVLSYNWKAKQSIDICFSMMQNFVQPLHEHMYQVWLYRSIDNTGGDPNSDRLHWYGDKYCTASRQCLKNMTLENITSTCQSCIENSDCILSIELL